MLCCLLLHLLWRHLILSLLLLLLSMLLLQLALLQLLLIVPLTCGFARIAPMCHTVVDDAPAGRCGAEIEMFSMPTLCAPLMPRGTRRNMHIDLTIDTASLTRVRGPGDAKVRDAGTHCGPHKGMRGTCKFAARTLLLHVDMTDTVRVTV